VAGSTSGCSKAVVASALADRLERIGVLLQPLGGGVLAVRGTRELKLEEVRDRALVEPEPASVERDIECEGAVQLLLQDALAV